MEITCNQCQGTLGRYQVPVSDGAQQQPYFLNACVCIKSECPNYGVLQVPAEIMKDAQ